MGADIHGPFVLVEVHQDIWLCEAELNWKRDYELFSLMAGVRSWSTGLDPLIEPRGLNGPMLPPLRPHLGYDDAPSDCHSHSWLTIDELAAVIEAYCLTQPGPEGVPFQPRLGYKFMCDVAAMWTTIKGYHQAVWQMQHDELGRHPGWDEPGAWQPNVRLAFCFDN